MKAQSTGMCGVYLVAAELSRRGFIASPTSRSARGADILVTDQLCQNAFSVQVKSNAGNPNFWLVGSNAKTIAPSNSHIYVLVNLKSRKDGCQPEYHIVPSAVIHKRVTSGPWFSIYRDDNESKNIQGIAEFKDKWDVFGDPHAEAGVEESSEMGATPDSSVEISG
jgi:hypothetical protein